MVFLLEIRVGDTGTKVVILFTNIYNTGLISFFIRA